MNEDILNEDKILELFGTETLTMAESIVRSKIATHNRSASDSFVRATLALTLAKIFTYSRVTHISGLSPAWSFRTGTFGLASALAAEDATASQVSAGLLKIFTKDFDVVAHIDNKYEVEYTVWGVEVELTILDETSYGSASFSGTTIITAASEEEAEEMLIDLVESDVYEAFDYVEIDSIRIA